MMSLAELALVLLLGMTALAAVTSEKKARAEARNDSLRTRLEEHERRLSNIPPPCPGGPLFRAVILGTGHYLVTDSVYSLSDLRSAYRRELLQARRRGCSPVVIAIGAPTITYVQYRDGLLGLEQLVYYIRKE